MSGQKYEIDMSKGSIFKNMVRFAIPVIITNVLQVLYNAADLIVVSRWAGNEAMASVGATGYLNNLIINVFIGLSLGASIVISRRYGAGDAEGVHKSVHTAIFMGIVAGISASVVGLVFSKPLLELMGTPEGMVLDGASLYMRIIYIGMPATLIYNFGAAIMRAVGDAKRPLYILMITGLVNVVLNLVFVIGFDMGVAGVASATAISNFLSMFAVIYYLIRSDGVYRLIPGKIRVYKSELIDLIRIGLPAGIQGSVFSLSNVIIQSTINSFGAAAIAGSAAAGNVETIIYMLMTGFTQATTTAVSQNYGAKNEPRIRKSIRISILCVSVIGLIFGMSAMIFARPLSGIYITDSQAATGFAVTRMIIMGPPYFMGGIMEVLTCTLRGLGYSVFTAAVSFIGVCGFRLLWVFTVLPLHRTTGCLFLCWPLSWLLVVVVQAIFYMAVKKRAMERMYTA